ncbi:hypothetical protein [Actinoplanes sp. NBRC 101535]|uniref:hypothetical protein n=1 Tax=Actinoplanes sp. NBRC 101535 TaxID=3032196 RepID=UPI0024A450AC|nr:hypothetical protein [Actinoplanes sp. NBRC 101535]GLY07554.1 hypothetical protein Acsp01_79330 [Actinoplanes sp. NBRC 101535]
MDDEPHRALAEAVLAEARARAEWLADGGPVPSLPDRWSALWRATVHRQADLAEQPDHEAERAVQTMLGQLTSLYHDAPWFRDEPALRDRAIAETLLFTTGLGPAVPSRAAQVAWIRREGMRPADFGGDDRRWLDEWNAWATHVRTS